ncbi:helix-turn-helix domain-containing protein [Nocardioides euryhalodurans]|uniref:Helix-turn-helix domain-containing protein n=1 Tax=Nocardioides euryhalodurans TaxID=2518370 RepID=A0A4P7GJT0_9ACTN|nr:helix-turn-helix domain-containing protein [Nocardioides euryhalodurans]QBR92298.1 helix-turn-helix domain-containing protein [Nocardioides euryhalodurans]
MTDTGRDRLRELLDAVLDDEHHSLGEMAGGAYASPYHFSRLLSRDAGEPPVAMRRRVMLERAAWQLGHGSSVTDAAFEAGYESVEGFSRAFARAYGHLPSDVTPGGSWLPAPNGIHFHPPTSLWVHSGERTMTGPLDHLVHHDLDDTRDLLEAAKQLPDADYREVVRPGQVVLSFDGADESLAQLLQHQVFTKEVWLAAILGEDFPPAGADDPGGLIERQEAVAGRWLAMLRDMERRDAWDDRIVDALCDPPESFVLGSIVAHVLTFGAHRRQLARAMLRERGLDVGGGDPIDWLARRHQEQEA